MQSEFNLAKVELHLHQEEAAPPAPIRQIAHDQKADINGIFDDQGFCVFRDFTHFRKVYEAATRALTEPINFYRFTRAVLDQSAAHGVAYTEAFLSPKFYGQARLGQWREYLSAVQEATQKAERVHGVVMNGIVTHICHFLPDKAKNTDLFTAETSRDFICGFGMGDKEIFRVQADYLYNFNVARQAGLCLTTYAGEWGGAESVRQEIFDLKVERLGHGAQIIKDSHFLNEFNACNISLEVCPGSNVAIGIYRMTHSHPTEKLWNLGVNVTVSTDDPPFFS